MIRSHFGLSRNPFDPESMALLPHQQESFDILRVHAQQGGLCLVLGEPGTGKTVLKQALLNHDPKRMITPVVNRTLHTYHNTLRILCQAFQIEFDGQRSSLRTPPRRGSLQNPSLQQASRADHRRRPPHALRVPASTAPAF